MPPESRAPTERHRSHQKSQSREGKRPGHPHSRDAEKLAPDASFSSFKTSQRNSSTADRFLCQVGESSALQFHFRTPLPSQHDLDPLARTRTRELKQKYRGQRQRHPARARPTGPQNCNWWRRTLGPYSRTLGARQPSALPGPKGASRASAWRAGRAVAWAAVGASLQALTLTVPSSPGPALLPEKELFLF